MWGCLGVSVEMIVSCCLAIGSELFCIYVIWFLFFTWYQKVRCQS